MIDFSKDKSFTVGESFSYLSVARLDLDGNRYGDDLNEVDLVQVISTITPIPLHHGIVL